MKLADTGLRRQPFQTHGKPLVLVPYTSQKAAIRFFNETRFNNQGLGLFHGPPLSGKTSVIRRFTALLPDDYAVAVVDGAGMNAAALLQEILSQFGCDLGLDSANERFSMVRVFAMQQTASDQAPLLIIENAHAMSPVLLEMLCELAELTVDGKSALRIILVSDRPMLPIVRAPALQPISTRVTGKFLLQPLTRKETANYVYKKLQSGGCRNPQGVVPAAVCDRLHTVSGGWPGMIDRLALMALSRAEHCPLRVDHIAELPAAKRKTAKTRTRKKTAARPAPNPPAATVEAKPRARVMADPALARRHDRLPQEDAQVEVLIDSMVRARDFDFSGFADVDVCA